MLTAMGPWRLKSSGAHCDGTLAVEVQRCSLRSDPGGSPAVLTAILGWRRGLARSLAKRIGETLGEEDWRGGGAGGEEEDDEEEEQTALIKSNNLHLAGGKKGCLDGFS